MAYLSLYRKYRSQSFDELAGQDHVTRTIQNAVKTGKVAHAYLFCGPRGTGKTSTARLLAKALNCEHGPTATPCNQCAACEQITSGSYMDLKEIDAASNRGIDDFRDLRENVVYTPTHGRYVVWVIDEVHQVTPEGFNAFLKTLEEPPPHVVFVLATTEVHKIPATIVSRCQRFEFRRASLEQLKERIAYVAGQEGAQVDAGALDLIAREANGGWRDALSLLEQVLAFCDGVITTADVYQVLGTVAADTLHALAESVRAADGAAVFQTLEELVCEGKDPRQLLRDLTQHYRMLMLTAAGSPPPGDPDLAARVAAQAKAYGSPRLIAAIEVLAQAEREARWSEQPRLLLELALVRLMHPREAAPVAAPAAVEPRAAARVERPAPAPRQAPAPSPFVDEPAPRAPRPSPPRSSAGFGTEELPPPPLTVGDARTGGGDDDGDFLAAFDSLPAAQPRQAPPPPTREQTAPPQAPEPAAEAGPAESVSPDLGLVARKWKLIREELKRINKRTVEASLVDTEPSRFEKDVLIIRFPTRTMAEMFTQRGKTFSEPLEQCIQRVTGIQCRVRSEFGSAPAAQPAAPPAPKPAPKPAAAPRQVAAAPRQVAAAAPPPQAPSNGKADTKPSPAAPPPPPLPMTGSNPDLTHDVLEIFDGQILDEREYGG